MKVVLFCGGLGTRLRDYSENVPKPLVPIGFRPILWHVMRYYAHFGHRDFILCLGYRGDKIKEYFLNYNEYLSNDFVMARGGQELRLANSDIDDWTIRFVDTGLRATIGERLRRVREHLEGDEYFLANYADGLTDLDLNRYIQTFQDSGKTAAFVCAIPSQTFHIVHLRDDNLVCKIEHVKKSELLVNAGYFVFRKDIFDYMQPGEELVEEPFQRLIQAGQLVGQRHDTFWAMDTFKEQQELSDMQMRGEAPWEVWNHTNGWTHPNQG